MLLTLAMNRVWWGMFSGWSLLHVASWNAPVVEGFCGWFCGTFFFYWWHRLRHTKGFWQLFHQVHHSPA
jgi:sterol desaturase/sphingolipid hydroxylase (fatty acid hydroxylase superfamily)